MTNQTPHHIIMDYIINNPSGSVFASAYQPRQIQSLRDNIIADCMPSDLINISLKHENRIKTEWLCTDSTTVSHVSQRKSANWQIGSSLGFQVSRKWCQNIPDVFWILEIYFIAANNLKKLLYLDKILWALGELCVARLPPKFKMTVILSPKQAGQQCAMDVHPCIPFVQAVLAC